MHKFSTHYFPILFFMCIAQSIGAMTYDNRYIPLFLPQQTFIEGLTNSLTVDLMLATASRAFGDDDKDIGIPQIFGDFDLNTLALAIASLGENSGLRSDLLGRRLPFFVDGRLQAQGAIFRYYKQVSRRFWLGGTALFMHVNARQIFNLDTKDLTLTPSDQDVVERARRSAFQVIGLTENNFSRGGSGDLTLYARFGDMWDYIYKCRRIYAGLSLGLLVPTGVKHTLFNAASLPFGGDGFWGIYGAADALFELKEDIEVGLLFRINKRCARTVNTRFSVNGEPEIFGALIGPARINPGPTIIFSPYFTLKHLRKGLGIEIVYTLTYHGKDSWKDKRSDTTIPVQLSKAESVSSWGSDYFTIDIFYDFGKIECRREFDPIVSFKWDIPSQLFVSRRVPKTNKVSIGVELLF